MPVNTVFILLVGKIDIGHVRLNFWDLGGQEELQSLWDKVSNEDHVQRGGGSGRRGVSFYIFRSF